MPTTQTNGIAYLNQVIDELVSIRAYEEEVGYNPEYCDILTDLIERYLVALADATASLS